MLYFGEKRNRCALLAQQIRLCVDENRMQPVQCIEQRRICRHDLRERTKRVVLTEAQFVLQASEPGNVDVKHAIRPALVCYGIARVNVVGIHQDNRTRASPFARVAIHVQAASACDRADGERFMRVSGVADLAAVLDGTCLDVRQRLATPETRLAGALRVTDRLWRSAHSCASGFYVDLAKAAAAARPLIVAVKRSVNKRTQTLASLA